MGHRQPRVRVSGMIWHDQRLLLVRQGRPGHPRWMLPGGGVDPGESMTVALARELGEELACAQVSVAEPCALVESIAPESHASGRHVIHVVFRVDVPDPTRIPTGTRPEVEDRAVQEIRWVDRDGLLKLPLHPPIGGYLKGYQPGGDFQYFGSLWAP
jgi:ADP-ribose pyrophosphatase YjhB (NUDIX family)